MGLQKTFDSVYSINEGYRLKQTITNGMVSKKKSQMQIQLAKMYDSNPQSVYALEMQCNAWRAKLSRHLISKIGKSSNRNVIKSAFLSAPDAPATPSTSNPRWQQSKMMMDKSFTTWNKTGRMTTQKFKQKLLDSLKKDKLPQTSKVDKAKSYKGRGGLTLTPVEGNPFGGGNPFECDVLCEQEEKKKKIIKDKISKCMFKNVKKVTNALQFSIVQKECKRQAKANTK